MKRLKLSARLKAEQKYVEEKLAGKVICHRCGASLESYSRQCEADLGDTCDGFWAIERAEQEFRKVK